MKGCVCVCVCFQIKTRQVFRQLPQILPRVTGKKGNICPSPVSDINTSDDDPDMWCKLLLYNSIKQVLGPAGSAAAVGSLPPPDTSRFGDRESGSGGGQTCKQQQQQHLSCGATAHERPAPHAGAGVLVLMQQRKEEEFVFTAIYR